MCAVATAWPAARAAAVADLFLVSRAAACARTAAFRASPTETSPLAQALAVSIARRGRSSERPASNSDKTCSAQSAAQTARSRCSARSSGPPRWTATKRRSLIMVSESGASHQPSAGIHPKPGVLFPEHEITAPVGSRVGCIGQHPAFAELPNGNRRVIFASPRGNDFAAVAGQHAVEAQDRRHGRQVEAVQDGVLFRYRFGAKAFGA